MSLSVTKAMRLERLLVPVLVGLVALLSVGFIWQARQPPPFDPFTFAPQRIEEVTDTGLVKVPTIEGYEGPAVYVGEPVPVSGVRCSMADEIVSAEASVFWTQVQPGDARVRIADDIPASIEPGCVPLRFLNQMPVGVIGRMFLASEAQLWRIVGDAHPTQAGGVKATWATESFWVVPRA